MDRHYREDIAIAALAELASISPDYFTKLFIRLIGQSPKQYLLAKRLASAAYCLTHSQESITQIALDSGFDYLPNFHRAFKQQTGLSPRSYRERYDQGGTDNLDSE
jgi:transcriptional regulator GlxA family with amidase domain